MENQKTKSKSGIIKEDNRDSKIIKRLKIHTKELEKQLEDMKRVQDALHESQESLNDIIETVSEGILYTTLSGDVLSINKNLANILDISVDRIIGNNILGLAAELLPEANIRKLASVFNKVVGGKAVDPFLVEYKDKILEVSASVNRRSKRLTGTIRDITKSKRTEDALLKSEIRLTRAELASKSGNWELHLGTGLMNGSAGALKLYGIDSNQMKYTSVKNIPLPEYRQIMDKALDDLIKYNKPYNIDFKIKNATTGEIIDIHSISEYDKENRILFGVIQDITDRKKAAEVINKNNLDLSRLLDITLDLLETVERKKVFKKIVEGATSLIGLDTGAIYFINGDDLFLEATIPPLTENFPDEFRKASIVNHPHIHEAVLKNTTIVINDIKTVKLSEEEKIITGTRDLRSILYLPIFAQKHVVGTLILGTSGRLHHFDDHEIDLCRTLSNIASLTLENSYLFEKLNQNVSELKLVINEKNIASEALKESEEKYRNIFTNVRDVFYQTDVTGTIREISPSVEIFTGFRNDELLNTPVMDMYYDLKDRAELLKEIYEKGEVHDYELKLKTKSGNFRIGSIYAHLVMDDSGTPHHIDGTIRDITERRELFEKLLIAKEKAEESDRLKTAFLHNISHEIRTPLNAIIGFSGFLEQTDLTPETRKEYNEIIFQSNNQLLSIINDILNISKIEAGQVEIKARRTDLPLIMKNLYIQYKPLVEKKNLEFRFNSGFSGPAGIIITDENKIIHIITNLLNNALKFTQEGFIELGFKLTGDSIEIYVEDTGIGIPEAELERVFDRFYQVDNSENKLYSGTGLGLSISNAFAKILGGKFTVRSTLGKGSAFSFLIPYRRAEKVVEPIRKATIDKEARTTKVRTILVAEDEESNYNLIVAMLKAYNFNILRAFDGQEAIDICKTNDDIDLVLMDIKMKRINGFECVPEILKIKPHLHIIAQTAFAHPSDRMKALQCGCSDYIAKPFNKMQLLSVIEKYVM